MSEEDTRLGGFPPRRAGRRWIPAAFAALIVLGLWGPNLLRPPPPAWTVYTSTKGQIRRVLLADKSVLRLNGASSARVIFDDNARRAALGQAEAALLVAPGRPFLISAGDRQVRIDGGELNILRQTTGAGAATTVTIRKGRAAIYPVGQSEQTGVSAGPGQQVSWIDGQPDAEIRAVNADNAFAWETHRLAYDNAPLSQVIADLNRYVERPIRLADPSLDGLLFTGRVPLQGETGMLRRIEADLPVEAQAQPSTNEIILRRLPPCGYKNCDRPSRHKKPGPLAQSLMKLKPQPQIPSPVEQP